MQASEKKGQETHHSTQECAGCAAMRAELAAIKPIISRVARFVDNYEESKNPPSHAGGIENYRQ